MCFRSGTIIANSLTGFCRGGRLLVPFHLEQSGQYDSTRLSEPDGCLQR